MTMLDLTEVGFPPAGEVFDVSSFTLRLADGDHPWTLAHREAIDGNWMREREANPHLFNGTMVFQRTLSFQDGHIEGAAHLIPYSAFLHWRRTGRRAGGFHLFSMPLIVSADGALMAVRMAETTANPGRVYPPAGSLDDSDIRDGLCDLEGNMIRETREETGLDLTELTAQAGYHAVHADNTVAVFRCYHSPLVAKELSERAAIHAAGEDEPEISSFFGIRSATEIHDYPTFMPPVLAWLFDKGMK
jgi:8-oxo-dGTP pyrophosphatase MutT (NUDIX family)